MLLPFLFPSFLSLPLSQHPYPLHHHLSPSFPSSQPFPFLSFPSLPPFLHSYPFHHHLSPSFPSLLPSRPLYPSYPSSSCQLQVEQANCTDY
jgi:hypothetical protein